MHLLNCRLPCFLLAAQTVTRLATTGRHNLQNAFVNPWGRILPMDRDRFRLVPHVNITREDIRTACEVMEAACDEE